MRFSDDEGVTLAHGIGGAKDLPISPELAIAGAVAALAVSFTVLALAWRTPRYDAATSGRPAPAWLTRVVDSTWFPALLRVLGFAFFLYVAAAAVFGEDTLINPIFGVFYVWWWIGIVPLSLLFGPFWKAISPVRTLNLLFAKATGGDPERGLYEYPARLGYWPAAVGLFAFVWMELVYPYSTELGPVRLWCAVYVAAMLVGGALFGNRFYQYADPFEVYSTLVGHLSAFGRRPVRRGGKLAKDDGATELVIRSPLANLDAVPVHPGLVAVVSVLLGSTAFDSYKDSSPWIQFLQSTTISTYLLNNLAILAFCVILGLGFAGATAATGVSSDQRRDELPNLFAHSMVPIVVGYIVAHYLNYFIQIGQETLINLSDPFSTGQNLLGTANLTVSYWFADHQTLLASLKVIAVVLGHVVAVVAAHDRAIRLLPRRHQLTGQLPLLFAMVGITAGGLYLLFAG
ncbi:hypothetical protein [Nocardioides speluncae]|uniref:hypothetical protein n=1 Tax=Nocardioides speluncae TaxID=2670337 RepID=UPI000D6914F6|nr:hypothetical protein [Nocardioides speluncae]